MTKYTWADKCNHQCADSRSLLTNLTTQIWSTVTGMPSWSKSSRNMSELTPVPKGSCTQRGTTPRALSQRLQTLQAPSNFQGRKQASNWTILFLVKNWEWIARLRKKMQTNSWKATPCTIWCNNDFPSSSYYKLDLHYGVIIPLILSSIATCGDPVLNTINISPVRNEVCSLLAIKDYLKWSASTAHPWLACTCWCNLR